MAIRVEWPSSIPNARATFDQVATLSVEGLNKSAIARVEGIGWNTVDRWLEKACDCGRRFNDKETTGFQASELQADEIRTITKGKQQPTWIFAAIEVWSRLWTSTVVGRRSYHNALALFGSKIANMTEKGYSHKFSNFNIDGIFGNHSRISRRAMRRSRRCFLPSPEFNPA
jgi:transposase